MFLWVLAIAAAKPSKAHMPAKLLAAQHRFELAHEQEEKEVEAADRKMEAVGNKAAAAEERFEEKGEQLREHAEQKMEQQDDAFEAALQKTEEENRKEANELLKKYDDHMRSFESKFHHDSSFLQTAGQTSDQAASQQILAEAREAVQSRLGDRMRDLIKQAKDSHGSLSKRLEGARQDAAEKMEGLQAGMKKEKERLAAFTQELRGEHRFIDRTMDAERDAYQAKIQQTEDRIEAEDKERQAKFAAKEEADTKAFRQEDIKRREFIEDAFGLPHDY